MAKLPDPPAAQTLAALGADLHRWPAGAAMGRIYFRGGDHPADWNAFRHWGPGGSRFDHHLGGPDGEGCVQPRGILYAAGAAAPGALAVCAAEVFQATRLIRRRDRAPWFAVFAPARELQLLDLTGLWPTRAGASMAIATGPKARARGWSRAIYRAFPRIDGLIYGSSMAGNAPVVALYERAADALGPDPAFNRALEDDALFPSLSTAAARIGYALI
ncbi:hypothetical protein [Mangrovicoccus algicola]|uniref:RES domain-containing protein n=1 Tax=Mangrovicoccus algicola TaxID=2771008 RepID=A0A8J6YTV4_9RHOB|nr:hypothetical protein [Mangrovicoccus algicola]MBE3637570.1 hypothetical protein [Mangrovicoccus algicola]